ncbi:RICIN domain-containing protein [Streptomyces nondiastaticus]|uniref:RICIN domain-containing protein n=1 Tax=Streptomyces nondiastaticus TaxID=3154512 RepID=UPI00343208C8
MPVGIGDLLFGIPLAGFAVQNRFNQHRAGLGRLPLFIDKDLSTAANRHTTDIADHPERLAQPDSSKPNFVDPHIGSDGSAPADRIIAAAAAGGWRPENDTTGEIMQWGGAFLSVDAALHFWLVESAHHRERVEDPAYTHMGFSASHNSSADEWNYTVDFARSPTRPLYSVNSGKVLDVTNMSNDHGAPIQQWDWWGGWNQQFTMEPTDGGYVRLRARNSGLVLDVAGVSRDNGARIIQWDWWGGENQQFLPEVFGIGEIKLTARHSGRSLDVKDFSVDNGAPIQQWDWWGGANQRWRF